jgi:predicted MPP superfamily phosphohydrolase
LERADATVLGRLEERLGKLHARQRLGIEADHEAQKFGQGLNFFHIENWYSVHSLIRGLFKLSGLYRRGLKNAADVQVRRTDLVFPSLPTAFEGFTLLHVSDLHVDLSKDAMERVMELLPSLEYDICVLTGDFRGATFGPFATVIEGLAQICTQLRSPAYGVLGNHDTIRMVPALEDLGIKMLLNECVSISRANEHIYLAGIDDAHFYRLDSIEKATSTVPPGSFTILLSHTPEVYRHAAHAGCDLLLSGHTHGGQICLPGSVPITLSSALPRRFGSGIWKYQGMTGYTSVGAGSAIVPIRLNCPPEITLHRLHSAQRSAMGATARAS